MKDWSANSHKELVDWKNIINRLPDPGKVEGFHELGHILEEGPGL